MLSLTSFVPTWHSQSSRANQIQIFVVSHYDIQNALFRDGFLSVRGYDKTLMREAHEDLDQTLFGLSRESDGSYMLYVRPGREMDFYGLCARIKACWQKIGR